MTIERYEHHGRLVSVDTSLKGKHREHCLCFTCGKFNMDDPAKKCPIAHDIYLNCVKHGVVTPVYECPEYTIEG
jgi:hypothetical protein